MKRAHTDPSLRSQAEWSNSASEPQAPTPEACPPGSKTVEGPLAQPSIPPSQQAPLPLKQQTPQMPGERSPERTLLTHEAKGTYGFGKLALGTSFLMSKSSRYLLAFSTRLTNDDLTKRLSVRVSVLSSYTVRSGGSDHAGPPLASL